MKRNVKPFSAFVPQNSVDYFLHCEYNENVLIGEVI